MANAEKSSTAYKIEDHFNNNGKNSVDTNKDVFKTTNKSIFDMQCMKSPYFIIGAKCFAELIGSGMLVFFGCMGLVTWGHEPNHMAMVLNFGFVIMIIIQLFAHISGAHFNPCLSISAYILGTLPIKMVIFYFFSQMIGGVLGYGLLKALTPNEFIYGEGSVAGVCSHVINPLISVSQAFFIEFLATGVLILVCCSVWDKRNITRHDSVPIKFGFTIFVLAFTTGPYTGCGMNPARSFAPAVWNSDYDSHWIFWVAPICGSAFVTVLYKLLYWPKD